MRRLWVKQIQNTKERFVNICEKLRKTCSGDAGAGGVGGGEILTLLHPDFETLSSVCTFFSTQNCFVK